MRIEKGEMRNFNYIINEGQSLVSFYTLLMRVNPQGLKTKPAAKSLILTYK